MAMVYYWKSRRCSFKWIQFSWKADEIYEIVLQQNHAKPEVSQIWKMIVLLPVVLRWIFCASAVEFLKGIRYTVILHDPWWTTMIVGVEIHFPDVLGLFPLFRIIWITVEMSTEIDVSWCILCTCLLCWTSPACCLVISFELKCRKYSKSFAALEQVPMDHPHVAPQASQSATEAVEKFRFNNCGRGKHIDLELDLQEAAVMIRNDYVIFGSRAFLVHAQSHSSIITLFTFTLRASWWPSLQSKYAMSQLELSYL